MNSGADQGLGLLCCCMMVIIPLGIVGLIAYLIGRASSGSRRPRRRRRRPPSRRRRDEYYERGEVLEPDIPDETFEMRFRCPHCDKKYTIRDEAKAGSKAKCQECGKLFRIPEPPA